MKITHKIGLGGGCHWCTEAVFQSLKGVLNVEQGWIASEGESVAFSEAVIVEYLPEEIPLKVLIEIHLHTHKSTSLHSMRKKYRSAIYYFQTKDKLNIELILDDLRLDFRDNLITQILPYQDFKVSREQIRNYYYNNPKKPFCETFINPKLKLLLKKFAKYTDEKKMDHLNYAIS